MPDLHANRWLRDVDIGTQPVGVCLLRVAYVCGVDSRGGALNVNRRVLGRETVALTNFKHRVNGWLENWIDPVIKEHRGRSRMRQDVAVTLQDLVPWERPVLERRPSVVIFYEGHGARRPDA